ncbi:MAG: UDP-4-amino-4,6-dideoxy-N-acetyl-beta-L-altrosamine transaminase [Planctomycetota bacterium]
MDKLAIEGGTPVREKTLSYGAQWINETDEKAVIEVLRSDWLTTGPKVEEFENKFAARVDAECCVAINSGTAALHVAAFAAGIKEGDEVITTPMTFVASANSILYQKARPVFADVEKDTLNINVKNVEAAITSRTKAIIAVDYTGQPVDMDELKNIAVRHHLTLIEDAAHSLGATYKGRPVGSMADLTTFSMHPVKHITTGEGGMVSTDSSELAQKMRWFRNHGITTDAHQRADKGGWFYEMVALGHNYRLSDINCALGISQLNKLDNWVARRKEIAARYHSAFSNMPAITTLSERSDRESSWHLYIILLNLDMLRVGRAEIFAALRAENIGVNVHYMPVYWHPYYKNLGYKRGLCPIAEDAYERMLTLPLFPKMSDKDANDVIEAVRKVVTFYLK